MSDDEEEYDSDFGAYEHNMEYHDSGGYGPLVPTETERTLMERVRQELKHELKQARVDTKLTLISCSLLSERFFQPQLDHEVWHFVRSLHEYMALHY